MIAFATLFLGLVFGVVSVELEVAAGVDSAKLYLDGREAATVRAAWQTRLDLGPALSPHELVAVALDPAGREVGRARQWINRPRAVAEASFVLEPGAGGKGRIARLTWQCLTNETPRSVTVTFDGRPLAAPDPRRIELPPHAPEQLHFLRAVVEFDGKVSAVADATFGGTRKAEALSELTALPVALEIGKKLPPVPELGEWFARRGEPLTVAAVEEGPARVVFLLAGPALAELGRIETGRGRPRPREVVEVGRWDGALDRQHLFNFVWRVPELRVRSKEAVYTYTGSEDFRARDSGVLWSATHLGRSGPAGQERIAEALATAGLAAAERDRRRAVVLLVGPEAADAGALPPEEAVLFLQRLGVPLLVWSVTAERPSPVAARFGPVADASTLWRFESAVASLSKLLDRQRIVWVEGTFLPHEIEPAAKASGITAAR